MTEEALWKVTFHRHARKDAVLVERSGLRARAEAILELLAQDPFASPPPFEKLIGDLAGAYSRRLTIQHRVVYTVLEDTHEVRVLRMWTHYE